MNLTVAFSENSELFARLDDAGPFYFAWADATEAFDPAIHARNDDDVFGFEIDHSEGDFATLRIQIKNPKVGLLCPDRKVWAWFSWRDAGNVVQPLIFGRLLGVPEMIEEEIVELVFVARPENLIEQKQFIADGIRATTQWDSIWFRDDDLNDPDKILEGMSKLFDIDRITLNVSLTDIANGADGTLSFDEDEAFYDSVDISFSQNPIRKVLMTAQVGWDQEATGTIDITHRNMEGNNRQGEHAGTIKSWIGQGLAEDWPQTGNSIGGGWTWQTATISVQSGDIPDAILGEWNVVEGSLGSLTFYYDGGFDTTLGAVGIPGSPGLPPIGWAYHVAIPLWVWTYQLVLGYDASRKKTETLTFTLEADVQSTLTEPDDGEVIVLNMSSQELVNQGVIDTKDRSYFATARGTQSVEYLLAVARAHLIARARSVDVAFDIPFDLAVASELSCRKNAVVFDDRLPDGTAAGKITRYRLSMSDGHAIATVHIGCLAGRGGTVEVIAGDPDYCDTDYCEDDYQFFFNEVVIPSTGDVTYTSIEGTAPVDDGVDLHNMNAYNVVKHLKLLNNINENDTDQEGALARFNVQVDDKGRIISALATPPVTLQLEVVDLTGGPFETTFELETGLLKIPRTVNLEACAYV